MNKYLTTCLTHSETAKLAIHDIRLTNAVYSPDTDRFHPDIREHRHVSANGKILTNLFQIGTAIAISATGETYRLVARNAHRAAAAAAIRSIRAGNRTCQNWNVVQTTRTGRTYQESVFFATDCGIFASDEFGDEKSNVEISHQNIRSDNPNRQANRIDNTVWDDDYATVR